MGWIPCSGKSNTKAKSKKDDKKVNQKHLDQINSTSGIIFLYMYVYSFGGLVCVKAVMEKSKAVGKGKTLMNPTILSF